ncbi:hypothetical protein BZA70DRAFT_273883 [Myxozyma melibiosi]|uniref:COP9 signalosome complex subunit 4 n=1 Tax=Myxozyma melibiosi TaxID=54550 RepID=A0ABR1FF72_9ASCO
MDPATAVADIAAQSSPQPDKIAQLESIITALSSSADLLTFLTAVLQNGSNFGLVVIRPVVATFVSHITNTDTSTTTSDATLLEQTLANLQPVLVSFEEQDALIRERLASIYESQSRPTKAANILRGVKTDSGGSRIVSDDYRVELAVRILRNLLEDLDRDEAADADTAATSTDDDELAPAERVMIADDIISKTAAIIARSSSSSSSSSSSAPTPTSESSLLHFKLAQARVFEARKRFLDAASKFFELSHQQSAIDADDRLVCLSAAVSCALLSPAGPARGRLLASLIKDERLTAADSSASSLAPERSLLDKLFFDHLLPRSEIIDYLAACKRKIPRAHLISYGSSLSSPTDYERDSVLDKAVTEHNLLAASKLYSNISFDELAELLSLSSPDAAEGYAAKMIQERRLRAVIDRVDRLIYFSSSSSSASASASLGNYLSDEYERSLLKQWDSEILSVCLLVEDTVAKVQKSYPDLALAL